MQVFIALFGDKNVVRRKGSGEKASIIRSRGTLEYQRGRIRTTLHKWWNTTVAPSLMTNACPSVCPWYKWIENARGKCGAGVGGRMNILQ